jgi:hypothetical protein
MSVRPRRLVDAKPVVNMVPMLWRRIGRINAQCLDDLYRMKYLLDLRPTRQGEQDLATPRKEPSNSVRRAQLRVGYECARRPYRIDWRPNVQRRRYCPARAIRGGGRPEWSDGLCPKRMRFWIRFSIHRSSTCVTSFRSLMPELLALPIEGSAAQARCRQWPSNYGYVASGLPTNIASSLGSKVSVLLRAAIQANRSRSTYLTA